jgi:hypothetical protein
MDSLRETGASPHRPKGRQKCGPSPGTGNERAGTQNEECPGPQWLLLAFGHVKAAAIRVVLEPNAQFVLL